MRSLPTNFRKNPPLLVAHEFYKHFLSEYALDSRVVGSASQSIGLPSDIDIMIVLSEGTLPTPNKSSKNNTDEIFHEYWFRPHQLLPQEIIKSANVQKNGLANIQYHEIVEWRGWELDILATTESLLKEYCSRFEANIHMAASVWAIGQPSIKLDPALPDILTDNLMPLYKKGMKPLDQEKFQEKIEAFYKLLKDKETLIKDPQRNVWSELSSANTELGHSLIDLVFTSLGLWRFDLKRLNNLIDEDIVKYFKWQLEGAWSPVYMFEGVEPGPKDYRMVFEKLLPCVMEIRGGIRPLYRQQETINFEQEYLKS